MGHQGRRRELRIGEHFPFLQRESIYAQLAVLYFLNKISSTRIPLDKRKIQGRRRDRRTEQKPVRVTGRARPAGPGAQANDQRGLGDRDRVSPCCQPWPTPGRPERASREGRRGERGGPCSWPCGQTPQQREPSKQTPCPHGAPQQWGRGGNEPALSPQERAVPVTRALSGFASTCSRWWGQRRPAGHWATPRGQSVGGLRQVPSSRTHRPSGHLQSCPHTHQAAPDGGPSSPSLSLTPSSLPPPLAPLPRRGPLGAETFLLSGRSLPKSSRFSKQNSSGTPRINPEGSPRRALEVTACRGTEGPGVAAGTALHPGPQAQS